MIKAISPSTGIRVCRVDVTAAATALEARHLSGPTAGLVLSEVLVGAALLSADASSPEETVYLRLSVTGPVKGVLAEAAGNGNLRGYSNVKVLNELDGLPEIRSAAALGDAASAEVVSSLPGKLLNRGLVSIKPAAVEPVIARYFMQSLQIPTAVSVASRSDSGGLIFARGILAQRMPDTPEGAFVPTLEAFNAGRVREALAANEPWESLIKALALPDLQVRETRGLQFACRCTAERVLDMLVGIPVEELERMAGESGPHNIVCHMCGNDYAIPSVQIRELVEKRKSTS